jgi:hypothetical protein
MATLSTAHPLWHLAQRYADRRNGGLVYLTASSALAAALADRLDDEAGTAGEGRGGLHQGPNSSGRGLVLINSQQGDDVVVAHLRVSRLPSSRFETTTTAVIVHGFYAHPGLFADLGPDRYELAGLPGGGSALDRAELYDALRRQAMTAAEALHGAVGSYHRTEGAR